VTRSGHKKRCLNSADVAKTSRARRRALIGRPGVASDRPSARPKLNLPRPIRTHLTVITAPRPLPRIAAPQSQPASRLRNLLEKCASPPDLRPNISRNDGPIRLIVSHMCRYVAYHSNECNFAGFCGVFEEIWIGESRLVWTGRLCEFGRDFRPATPGAPANNAVSRRRRVAG
jgi:hypothetical protein